MLAAARCPDSSVTTDSRPEQVRSGRMDQEERGETEEEMLEINQSSDTLIDQQPERASAGSHSQTCLPAVQMRSRAAAVSLGLLGIVLLTGIIIQSIYFIVEKHTLELERDQLNISHNQLLTEVTLMKKKLAGKLCCEGWTRFAYSCYYKSTEKNTWTNSRLDCQGRGSDLVVINSREEQEFVSKLNGDGASWIGLYHIRRQTWVWAWVDGSPLTTTYWAANTNSGHRASCCNQQGNWTRDWSYESKYWMCEK